MGPGCPWLATGRGPSKKDGHPGNATCRAEATRRATTIRHCLFHKSFSNTRLRTQRLRIIENDVGNIFTIIRQNAFLVAAFVSMPHFSDLGVITVTHPRRGRAMLGEPLEHLRVQPCFARQHHERHIRITAPWFGVVKVLRRAPRTACLVAHALSRATIHAPFRLMPDISFATG